MNFRFLFDNAACSIFFCSASEKQDTSFSFVFGRLILSVVYSFSSPSVGVGRGLKRSRQFKSCFSKNRSNVRYSWGISRILNQNRVNSEFVKWRPRNSRRPFFAFFMWNYFPLQGNITIFANNTQKTILPFTQSFYLSHQSIFLLIL